MRLRGIAYLLIPGLFMAALCASPMGLHAPPKDATRVMPLSEWAGYWYEVEECSGLRGDFRQVAWYVVNTHGLGYFPCSSPTGLCVGLYQTAGHAIYIAETKVNDRDTIAHESLHALGVLGHPQPPFGVCAPVLL